MPASISPIRPSGPTSPKERPILMSAPMVLAALADLKTETRRVIKPQPSEKWVDGGYAPIEGVGRFFNRTAVTNRLPARPEPDGLIDYSAPVPECLTIECPYGKVGDRLWVKETFAFTVDDASFIGYTPPEHASMADAFRSVGIKRAEEEGWILYRADNEHPDVDGDELRWSPSLFMPRWASRLTLEITSVKVQRIQEISEGNARAEGIEVRMAGSFPMYRDYSGSDEVFGHLPIRSFASLWDSINEKRGFGWDSNPHVWVIGFKRVEGEAK